MKTPLDQKREEVTTTSALESLYCGQITLSPMLIKQTLTSGMGCEESNFFCEHIRYYCMRKEITIYLNIETNLVILNLDWRQGRIAKTQQSKPKENSSLDHGADVFISRKNRLPVAL